MLEEHYQDRIPPSTKGSIDRWVKDGCPVGGFLTAVLCNDLADALGRADQFNAPNLDAIVGYLYNECPSGCWGSRAKYEAWKEAKAQERAKRSHNGQNP